MRVPIWVALWGLRVAAGPLSPNHRNLAGRAAAGTTADVSPTGGVCLTQWYTPGSGVNNVRSYHTRSDGSIVESRRRGDGSWDSTAIVLRDQWDWSGNASDVRAWVGGPLACAGEAVGDGPDDVQIRLFYQHVGEESGLVKLHSIVWKSDVGWCV
ncbi:hypothetical protein MAPG_05031 [Magnaporthiopsis poae ATCC 64411]|uniref:Fucose-specific lectin n=1 Tax=Magnaporthiopsis poae (strain ATCC 64411 / 73-15) TaxID=644358 RepID=A0A0C4DYB4_MAGP6|nr:hypothetical protein MAPG_05031 [Magnaporthiopsis poae ATCC 64411]